MLELLAPAGSPEAVVAAVQNGADSIYLGFGEHNARRNAVNFSEEELKETCRYCRVRGAKVYMTLNTLATDRELPKVEKLAKFGSRLGVDAILVQDFGVIRAVKQAVPDMPVHASTQMSVHSLEGVQMAAELGASRVVLARELSRENIAYICKNSPIEIEAFVHGALCMSYSGQCYMSAVIGKRSGNRGLCAQPCRLGYSLDSVSGNPLSLKDYCLANELKTLEQCGVKCIKIEGRMKRPEYTAVVTRVYSNAIKEGRGPTDEEMRLLEKAFSRQGFTDAYFKGQKGAHMLGIRTEESKKEYAFFSQVKKAYMNQERQRVPVRLYFLAKHGKPAMLAAQDDGGHVAKVQGGFPERAYSRELEKAELEQRLMKTGGTPYHIVGTDCALEGGLNISASEINSMRRAALDRLTELRDELPHRREGIFRAGERINNLERVPQLIVQISGISQLSDELLEQRPDIIYIPVEEILSAEGRLDAVLKRDGTQLAAVMPRVVTDLERAKLISRLQRVRQMGISQVVAGNIGHILLAQNEGFAVRGDFGLNVFNSQSLKTLKNMDLLSATASFELNLPQIRDLSKSIDTEIIAYGRLPLMLTENCVIRNTKGRHQCGRPMALSDRKGAAFPVMKEVGCRNVILNSQKLFLADKMADLEQAGLWAMRLMFTTENERECASVTARYRGDGFYEPGGFTRGLYYRGVE